MGTDLRTVVVITARIDSKRLKDKVLQTINDKPILEHIIDTARQSKQVDEVMVATTENSIPIQELCKRLRCPWTVGDEEDILLRIYEAGLFIQADVIVRLWGDAPLITKEQIDMAVIAYRHIGNYTTLSSQYGCVSVASMEALAYAHQTLTDKEQRHWIHKTLSTPITVDTKEDLEKVRRLVKRDN